ncbi:GGDEF domain-containing protein [Deinococcota bacterium DY0809b]
MKENAHADHLTQINQPWNGYYWGVMVAAVAFLLISSLLERRPADLQAAAGFFVISAAGFLLSLWRPLHARVAHSLLVVVFLAWYVSHASPDLEDGFLIFAIFSSFAVYSSAAMLGLVGLVLGYTWVAAWGWGLGYEGSRAQIFGLFWFISGVIGYGYHRVSQRIARLQAELEAGALSDPLTGLGNRRALERDYAAYQDLAERENRSLRLTFWDINDLKIINDTRGHEAGDQALVRFADLLRQHTRAHDRYYRIGGDEFVGLHLGLEHPRDLIERLGARFPWVAAGWVAADGRSFDEVYREADRKLYAAKSSKAAGRFTFSGLE